MTDNSIDCEEDGNSGNYYYSRTLSVSDGLWIGNYDDDSCTNLIFNTTIDSGYCDPHGGANSTSYTFANDDSGASGGSSGSDSASSDALSRRGNIMLIGLFVLIFCSNAINGWL